jgi:hypothetical protein
MSTAVLTPSFPKHWGTGTQLAALHSSRAHLAILVGLVAIVAWGFWPNSFGRLTRGFVDQLADIRRFLL